MPGVKGDVKVKNPKTSKIESVKYGEVSSGTQRGIKVGPKSYSLRGEGDTAGKEVNVHKSGAYVGKEEAFYKDLALVIASVYADQGKWPGKGIVLVGTKKTRVIIEPK